MIHFLHTHTPFPANWREKKSSNNERLNSDRTQPKKARVILTISCAIICLILNALGSRIAINVFSLNPGGYYLKKYFSESLNDTYNTTNSPNDYKVMTGYVGGGQLDIRIITTIKDDNFIEETIERIKKMPADIQNKYAFDIEFIVNGIEQKKQSVNSSILRQRANWMLCLLILYAVINMAIWLFCTRRGLLMIATLLGLYGGFYSCRLPVFLNSEQIECLNIYMKYILDKQIKQEEFAANQLILGKIIFKKKYFSNSIHCFCHFDATKHLAQDQILNLEYLIRKKIDMNFLRNSDFLFIFYENDKEIHRFILTEA